MKKIFILSLVLVTASLANAVPQIMVNGDKYATNCFSTSNHVSLGIWTDTEMGAGSDFYNFALVVDTLGTIDYATGFVVPPYDTASGCSCFLFNSISAANGGFPLPAGEDGIAGLVLWHGAGVPPVPAGSTFFDGIDYSSSWPLPVEVKLYLTDGITSYIVDTVSIATPEPTTIGLLGLGGLALRKKR